MLVGGCALVAWLEGPRSLEVLEQDLDGPYGKGAPQCVEGATLGAQPGDLGSAALLERQRALRTEAAGESSPSAEQSLELPIARRGS
jgi:hypothetical protein